MSIVLARKGSRTAQRALLMVILILSVNGIFFVLNSLSDGVQAWKLLIIYTIYCFVVWFASERLLDNIGRRYPRLEDTGQRIFFKFITFLGINAVLLGVNSVVCKTLGVWEIGNHWLESYLWIYGMVCFFGGLILAIYEVLYLFRKWKAVTHEAEQLKHEQLQTQLDSLKNQVNPHFLFNSFNSLSSLIEDDEPKAQIFVNELARVYRYLLQSNEHALTDLQSELAFIDAYIFLMSTRFGEAIQVEINVSEASKKLMIPPLTLQLLIENAVKHNIVSTAKPLKISIYTEGVSRDNQERGDTLLVSNNLQSKTITMALTHKGLDNIAAKYRLLSDKELIVEKTDTVFRVVLPLLSPEVKV